VQKDLENEILGKSEYLNLGRNVVAYSDSAKKWSQIEKEWQKL
jgi:orotidine-5'-phosphate decarboxylase